MPNVFCKARLMTGSALPPPWSPLTQRLIAAAIEEDLDDRGDVTAALLPGGARAFRANIVARERGVLAGAALLPEIAAAFSDRLRATLVITPAANCADGATLECGAVVATIAGPQAAVLTAERTLLNFLGRMSGVATLTRRFVDAARAANPTVQILDTRKTLPGWRELDKYAVRCGGGANHRFGLYDAVLIKDNHLAGVATGELADHVRNLLAHLPAQHALQFVQIEVDSLEQLDAVLPIGGVDIILLDNFTPAELRGAVGRRDAAGVAVALECSGGVRLDRVAELAATGVDRISVGALTHSAVNLDLGLDAIK